VSTCNHTQAEHDLMKADDVWATLEPVGFQPGSDEHGDLELKNAACGSTLCRRCLLTEEQRAEVREAARRRSESFRAEVMAARARRAA
jgi:hypothetical protein